MLKLDYTIKDVAGRLEQVRQLLSLCSHTPSNTTLEKITDYIYEPMSSKQKKAAGMLSNNTLATVGKRETSLEGFIEHFDNNEDMIYSFITNDKNVRLTQKKEITEQDLENIEGMRQLHDTIDKLKELQTNARGKDKYIIKKQIIELQQEQYILKYQNTGATNILVKQKSSSAYIHGLAGIPLNGKYWINDLGEPQTDCPISLFNKEHVSAILCNYSALKAETEGAFWNDLYYLMQDFDRIAAAALKEYPILEAIVTYKIDGYKNVDIKDKLIMDFGKSYTPVYISNLFRNKIPKLIADKAREEQLLYYYTFVEKGNWKKCSKCGQVKLAHNRFFSKNSTSKDGYYSICKACRNKMRKGEELFKDGN